MKYGSWMDEVKLTSIIIKTSKFKNRKMELLEGELTKVDPIGENFLEITNKIHVIIIWNAIRLFWLFFIFFRLTTSTPHLMC